MLSSKACNFVFDQLISKPNCEDSSCNIMRASTTTSSMLASNETWSAFSIVQVGKSLITHREAKIASVTGMGHDLIHWLQEEVAGNDAALTDTRGDLEPRDSSPSTLTQLNVLL